MFVNTSFWFAGEFSKSAFPLEVKGKWIDFDNEPVASRNLDHTTPFLYSVTEKGKLSSQIKLLQGRETGLEL